MDQYEYRINGFNQIKAFYSIVFEQKYDIKPQHVSLYVFLINQNNRNNWVEWFKCPYDLAMAGACIGNKRTYYKCLDDLQEWKLIKYEKGVNNWKSPKIKLEVLKSTSTDTATVPQSEPLLPPAVPPLPTPLLPLIYKHITSKLYNQKQLIELRDFINKNIIDEKFNFRKALLELDIEKQVVSDWLKVRSKKKATNTKTAFKDIKIEIEKSNITAQECIELAAKNSWAGFKASWVKEKETLNTKWNKSREEIDKDNPHTIKL